MKKKSPPKRYQTGGPVEPNIQTLGNIKFDSNKARKGKYGNLIVQDIVTGKDYGVYRKSDGAYEFLDTSNKVRPWESINPKNWGTPEYTQQKSFTDAFNLAKSQGNKEFYWKDKRFAVKDVDPSIANAIEVARNQVVEELANMGNTPYTPSIQDSITAAWQASKRYDYTASRKEMDT